MYLLRRDERRSERRGKGGPEVSVNGEFVSEGPEYLLKCRGSGIREQNGVKREEGSNNGLCE